MHAGVIWPFSRLLEEFLMDFLNENTYKNELQAGSRKKTNYNPGECRSQYPVSKG